MMMMVDDDNDADDDADDYVELTDCHCSVLQRW